MSSVSGGGGASIYGGEPAFISKSDLTPGGASLSPSHNELAYSVRATPGGGVEGAYVDQVSVSGEGVLTFASAQGANSSSKMAVELEIDGVNVLPALVCNGSTTIGRGVVLIDQIIAAGPVAFKTGFKIRTKETVVTTAINIKCYYQYRLTA